MRKTIKHIPIHGFVNPNTLPSCTEERVGFYRIKASEFIAASGFYNDCKSAVTAALAEYLAYQDGWTIRQ